MNILDDRANYSIMDFLRGTVHNISLLYFLVYGYVTVYNFKQLI